MIPKPHHLTECIGQGLRRKEHQGKKKGYRRTGRLVKTSSIASLTGDTLMEESYSREKTHENSKQTMESPFIVRKTFGDQINIQEQNENLHFSKNFINNEHCDLEDSQRKFDDRKSNDYEESGCLSLNSPAQYEEKEQKLDENSYLCQITTKELENGSTTAQPVDLAICGTESVYSSFTSVRPVLKIIFRFIYPDTADFYLNFAEMSILDTILDKKFSSFLPTKNIYNLNDFRFLAAVQPTKRPEECYKFVFKHTFRHLKERFCRAKGINLDKIKKQETMVLFYDFYFKEVSINLNIGIENFRLPLTRDTYGLNIDSLVAKTINSSYIRLIIKSKPFLNDFMEFINTHFREEYTSLIPRKIDGMVDKIEKVFEEAWYNERFVDIICENIRSNKRCKLPWTVKELDYSIRQVNKLIGKNLSKINN